MVGAYPGAGGELWCVAWCGEGLVGGIYPPVHQPIIYTDPSWPEWEIRAPRFPQADTSLSSSSISHRLFRRTCQERIFLQRLFFTVHPSGSDSGAHPTFFGPAEKGFSLKKTHFCHCTLVLLFKAVSSHFGAHPSYLGQTGSRAPRRDDVSGAASLRQHGEGKFQRRWGVVITKTKTFVFCICQDRRTGSGAFCGFWQPPVFQVHQLTHSRFIVIILITIRHYMKINWWGCIL